MCAGNGKFLDRNNWPFIRRTFRDVLRNENGDERPTVNQRRWPVRLTSWEMPFVAYQTPFSIIIDGKNNVDQRYFMLKFDY